MLHFAVRRCLAKIMDFMSSVALSAIRQLAGGYRRSTHPLGACYSADVGRVRILFSSGILLFISTLGLSGCVTVEEDLAQPMRTTVVMSGDIGELPPQAKTYSWHPQLQKVFTDTRLPSESVLTYMQTRLQQQLQAKGYHYVDNANAADFLMGFGVSIGSTAKGTAPLSDAQILASAGLVAGLSTQGVDTQEYDKGSVLVAVFKPNPLNEVSEQLIWRVLAQGFADIDDKNQLKERFDGLIDEMLMSFPIAGQ